MNALRATVKQFNVFQLVVLLFSWDQKHNCFSPVSKHASSFFKFDIYLYVKT